MVTTTTPGGQRVTICTCTRTGRHLATFTRRPGSSLYTLATEPPQVAASAQVSASGQVAASFLCRFLSHQTLLWHHRLGHPSLSRLCGMHSCLLVYGLPRSLPPLPPSPAPPCLPCVEGRQRTAPHSSSFPPTSGPLQTLHMDVWGPARVSGQSRERYFLLVVDDYMLYTTVFPLCSKGQVVDVLIPWIRTVRLQLRERFGQDLPVLRLHSDRGGEFSSNLLRDFCRGEGILLLFTLPDSSQQNEIAERHIGLVMEVARTSMIHAAAPHFLWSFAVQYAAHQLNLWPRISLPETSPTLRWTGEVGDASVFPVWGSRAFVRDTFADKLSPRAIPCVFLGFVPDAPGWQFYHPTLRRGFPSQDVTFDDLGSGSVSWRSTRSSSVLSSSCEAEIYAGAMAAQELRWLTYLLTDLEEQPRSPPVLYVYNKAMIALCQEHRTKHIALRYFLARELQQRGQLRLAYVATRANTTDIFTKALLPEEIRSPQKGKQTPSQSHPLCCIDIAIHDGTHARVDQLLAGGSRRVHPRRQNAPAMTGGGSRCGGGRLSYFTRPWRTRRCLCFTPRLHSLQPPLIYLRRHYVAALRLSSRPPPPPSSPCSRGGEGMGVAGVGVLGASASAASGAGESALSGTASAQVFHTFTLDSGASRSFFRDRTTLTPLSPPVAVSLADPSGGPVLASFSTVLPCPAAPSGTLSGLYLPSFSTNLVSGADLQDQGVDQFTPASQRVTHCTCARTGRHLATFTRRLGSSMYTLSTESPPVPPSGQVAASSQVLATTSGPGPESAPCSCRLLSHQTLLWHHRLGHPSLPRLRGMASHVLRAAPHSSAFPPTEAPLQTLHMDVWGPARIRGQGHERYFLLVVDDYSRYTTVFPLRSKGDVTETFTLPASPQKNGIAERRIGMVMDVARTSMIHAAAPHFLWPFVVQYAAHQLNLQPRVSVPETSPTLRWTGKVGDASVFRIWGPRAFVRDLSADKLSPRAVPCVFLGFPPDAPGWQFYHPTSRRVLSSQDVTFDESGPAPSGVSQVDAVEVAVDSGAGSGGAEPGGAGSGGVAPGGAETEGAEPGGAEPGSAEPGGEEPGGAGSARVASRSPSSRREILSPQELREWFARRWSRPAGAGGTPGAAGTGGAAAAAGVGPAGASGAAGAGATWGVGAGVGPSRGTAGAAGGTGAAGPAGVGAAGASGAPGAGAAEGVSVGGSPDAGPSAGAGVGAVGAGGAACASAAAEGTGAVPAGFGVPTRPRPYFVPLLEQVLGLPPSSGPAPSLECPQPVQSQSLLQPVSPLHAPSPYTGPTGGLAERHEPVSRPALPVRAARTSGRAPRQRPPAVPRTHQMALRPSTASQRVPLPSPPESSLPVLADPESDSLRAASPTVARLLSTVVTDPSFESAAASALVAELVDFAACCRLEYTAGLIAESASVCPPSVGGECALSTDVLEDRHEEFQCFAAALPHLVSMLIAPKGDPDAPDIPTPRSYAEPIEGPYSSQWQSAMDAEMASWKSTGTYVDEAPPPGANIVSGMWIFRVKRPPGSPPVFKAHYVARGFSQRQGVDYFQTFSPTPKMTTLRVLLHVAAQRDYELHSLDFSTAFQQGSLHEEIWLRRPLGFTGSFPPGTQWSLRRPVYGLRQAPREWHDTLRTTLAALGFAPSTADPSLFLRIDTSLPPFYILVYVDDLVFATADTAGLAHVKSELQKRHTCTDLGRRPVVLTGHADASWADDQATQRSSQVYTFSLGSGSVSWRSTRSSSVLGSSCEAEIYAGAMAAQELRWLTYLLTDLGEQPRSPPVLYVDNKAMLALCREHRLEHRAKQIALRYFLARELQQRGQLRLAYVAYQANTADIFTKALPPGDHQRFCTMLGLVLTWPHLLTS
ncbi:unnamed protein product [Closterium sp. NIES-54]